MSYVILGGKRIYTTSMSQQDYSSLVSQSVDVASTMSFEMSAAMGSSQQVKAGLVKGAAAVASKFGGPQAAAIGGMVDVALGGVDDEEVLFGASVEADSKYSLSQFASSKDQAEQAMKISNVKTTNKEVSTEHVPIFIFHTSALN